MRFSSGFSSLDSPALLARPNALHFMFNFISSLDYT